ncbi:MULTISPECIES: type II secretion system F family protein [unclassified Curtobacterium]|uniref:type II secretion system F family protein n=1 Tax=unclassified Curtobacterium TaxID=257496 RepID=UPI000825D145|nr:MULTISPECIES: type II secretion system F family protein [unclassified Curtobacterium]WIA95717.1 type II secretion system F family protein [Curtobacterium sp. MCBA15_004]
MTPDGPAAARVLDRVAVLVGAGVPPPRAWELVGGRPATGGPAWNDVRLVLDVAERSGAPTAGTLRGLASAMRRTSAADRAVRVALAGPRASARVVLALPAFGIGLGAAWGAGAVEVLLTRPVGWTCVVVAGVLVAVGRRWSGVLVRRASPDGRIPGVLLDAWAVALAGGGSWSSAGATVAAVLAEHGFDGVERPARGGSPAVARGRDAAADARLHEVLDLSRRAGVPAVPLLRAAAEDVRDDAAAAGLAAAERLGVRLVLPLGVCVLPAFVLVGVVPVVVGVLSSTVGGLG